MARGRACLAALAWLMALPCGVAVAADAVTSYPDHPIRIVVPFPAGGPTDLTARVIAQKIGEDWQVPVIVDNRPGGNTIIGAELVARPPPTATRC